ncbi:MAG: DHHA1 domain-containing protein, partial [Nitrosopumilaceae archaeon]
MASKKPKVKPQRTKVVCLSHKEDADGISSAALIREAFGGYTILEDYPGLMYALEKIKNDEKIKQLFICDLGLSNKNQDEFVQVLSELRK